ncbi:type II toxin-antitoxin system HicA family toxin [Runella sp.]|jgi:predicted RNA binding protein YcfA (HicA-like mRNA interferase family)|uniref:type II toxin-antitoxin system HicA family toxin n=1 Tax=Runella sp. TaxID=1960881 RepID=UPI0026231EBB|nr:type II toxin-antitoxin system HicA family toxin [Runella sp.]
MKRIQLIKHLKAHGCMLLREGGDHTIFYNPANGHQAPIGRHQELKNILCKKVCKQLGIPEIG